MDNNEKTIQLNLKNLLADRGLTQKEFAELVGISENSVSCLVNQPASIRIDTIQKICNALDIDPGDFIVSK